MLPSVDTNKPLILAEGSQAKITTQFLSASDKDSEPGNLLFSVLSNPLYGHLELSSGPGNTTVISQYVCVSSEVSVSANPILLSYIEGDNYCGNLSHSTTREREENLLYESV